MVLPGSGGNVGKRVDPAPSSDLTVLQVRRELLAPSDATSARAHPPCRVLVGSV